VSVRVRDGQLRLRSGRSTELAPLLQRSWSEREWSQKGAGAELEREFSGWSGAGAERFVKFMELERSRSDSFFRRSVNSSIFSFAVL
jgi:hypothetical protein